MTKPLNTTRAQAYWASASAKHDAVLAALRGIESHGLEAARELPARIAAEADALQKQQPRSARVSREEIEAHVGTRLRDDLREQLRPAARAARQQFEQSFEGLKALHAQQKRSVRQPRRPDGDVTEAERLGLSSLAEQRATRAELRELNARLELVGFSADELLEIAADTAADPARRYVAEGLVTRVLAPPPAHPEPPSGKLSDEQLLKHQQACRAIDTKHADAVARLSAIRDVRVPDPVKAREAATDALIASIGQRWDRLRGPFEIAERTGVPMSETRPNDVAQAEAIDGASQALIAAVEQETLAEARAV